MRLRSFCAFALTLQLLLPSSFCDVFSITPQNQSILNNYRVALVSFTADWCFFSRQLAPIFVEASNNFIEETKKAEVIFGRVDCDAHNDFCANLKITKYPTIKIYKYGFIMRKEYRQQRTVDAFTKFVQDHARENITVVNGTQKPAKELIAEHTDTRNVIFGAFPVNDTSNKLLQYFKQTAHLERDNCAFVMLEHVSDETPHLSFKDVLLNKVDPLLLPETYGFTHVQSWVTSKCTPVVRELTFANAEDITEEGLPLLILFYDENSLDLVKKFHEVAATLSEERKQVNFLTADGKQFAHPLSHMNKNAKDLPLFCIDSFAHMYPHPKSPHEILSDPAMLVTFINDLHSGKLHREFHYGPDKPQITNEQPRQPSSDNSPPSKTEPPESAFKKLKPSYLKYTLLHDEL